MLEKTLEYYQSLEYDIIIHCVEMDDMKFYMAYCVELGMGSCYGRGDTMHEALDSYIEDKKYFIQYLFENNLSIPAQKK